MTQTRSETNETFRILLIVVVAALLVMYITGGIANRNKFRKNRVVFGNFLIGRGSTINTNAD